MQQRVLSAAQAGYSVRRWTCAAFLPYRVLVHSVGRPIAAAAHQFLRYRGPVQNENQAVFLPHRFVRELAVCCCAAQTDFLPYRIAEKPEQTDVLPSEPAQRYCAAAQFLYAQTAPDLFLHCRQAVPSCAECQAAKPECLALHWARLYSVRPAVCQAAAQRCCAAVRIRSVSSAPVRWCCDTISLRCRSADWRCAEDFGLPFFLPHRTKPRQHDSVPMRCCADGILIGNVRIVPAAHFA